MKVLVTGAAGFLGGNLCRYLIGQGFEVKGVDVYEWEDCWRIRDLKMEYERIQIEDMRIEHLADVERIVHCAASSNVNFVWRSPKYAIHQTIVSSQHLAKLAAREGIPKFVNISTHSVYGRPQYTPVDEEHPLNATNLYGALKVAQEAIMRAYREQGLMVTTLRMSTLFGPLDRRGAAVYEIMLKVLKGETVTLTGDGTQTRDFNYVSNVCTAIELALMQNTEWSLYNIGSGEDTSIISIVEAAKRAFKVPAHVEFAPPRPGEEGKFPLSIQQAETVLGYVPKIDTQTGLEKMAKWITAHQSLALNPRL